MSSRQWHSIITLVKSRRGGAGGGGAEGRGEGREGDKDGHVRLRIKQYGLKHSGRIVRVRALAGVTSLWLLS